MTDDRDEWRRLFLGTGGVAVLAVGAWALAHSIVWLTARFAALVDRHQALIAAILHIGVLFGALAFLVLVAWHSSTREELPEGRIRHGEDQLDVARRIERVTRGD